MSKPLVRQSFIQIKDRERDKQKKTKNCNFSFSRRSAVGDIGICNKRCMKIEDVRTIFAPP